MFVLVKDNRVLVGPIVWNKVMFLNKLNSLGLNANLPTREPTDFPYVIDTSTSIRKCEVETIALNEKIEMKYGPFYDFTNDVVKVSYKIKEKPIEQIKSELKIQVNKNRKEKEQSGFLYTVKDSEVLLETDKEARGIYGYHLHAFSHMPDDTIISWKFNLHELSHMPDGTIISRKIDDIWIDLTKLELQSLSTLIHNYVQDLFQKEHLKSVEIDACTTHEELDNLNLDI